METEIVAYSDASYPSQILAKLRALEGKGRAYISDKTPNAKLMKPEVYGWTEIKDAEMASFAGQGYDIFYKTSVLGGKHRIYRSLEKCL